MTDTVDTSKEAVERLAGDCKLAEKVMRERNTFSTGQGILSDAAASLVALAAERDQLRREVEEARSIQGAAQVLLDNAALLKAEIMIVTGGARPHYEQVLSAIEALKARP